MGVGSTMCHGVSCCAILHFATPRYGMLCNAAMRCDVERATGATCYEPASSSPVKNMSNVCLGLLYCSAYGTTRPDPTRPDSTRTGPTRHDAMRYDTRQQDVMGWDQIGCDRMWMWYCTPLSGVESCRPHRAC